MHANTGFNVTFTGFPRGELPPIHEGWNLIGVNGTDPVPLEDFLDWVPCNVKYVYGYMAGDWVYYIEGIGGGLDTLYPGERYWVYCGTG